MSNESLIIGFAVLAVLGLGWAIKEYLIKRTYKMVFYPAPYRTLEETFSKVTPEMERYPFYRKRIEDVAVFKSKATTYTLEKDGCKLHGQAIINHRAKAMVILVHGWKCCGELRMSEALDYVENGFSALVVDVRGCGDSKYFFVDLTTAYNDDLLAWAQLVEDTIQPGIPVILDGVSMGGAQVLSLSSRAIYRSKGYSCNIAAIISDSGYCSVDMVCHDHLKAVGHFITKHIMKRVHHYAKKDKMIWKQGNAPINVCKQADIPTLLFHGTGDKMVGFHHFQQFKQLNNKYMEFVPVEGAEHIESAYVLGSEYMERKLAFIEKVLMVHLLLEPNIKG